MSGLFSNSIYKVLETSINGATLKQQVLSNNIANVDTPGFKRSDVEFKSLLKQSLQQGGVSGKLTHQKHIPIGKATVSNVSPKVFLDKRTSMRLDGNNVDIELESAEMAKNTIYHSAMTQQLVNKFNSLHSVISEGRR